MNRSTLRMFLRDAYYRALPLLPADARQWVIDQRNRWGAHVPNLTVRLSFPYEWCLQAYKDAARKPLQIAVVESGLGVSDSLFWFGRLGAKRNKVIE